MKNVVIIYPHQLFEESPVLAAASDSSCSIYLIEEPLILTHNPIHKAKLLFHKLSLDAYETWLTEAGHEVIRLSIIDHPKTTDVFARLKKDGVKQMHIVDTVDTYLEEAIKNSGIDRIWYESPQFLLEKADAEKRFTDSKRFMATFYKGMRRDFNILMDGDKPLGGKWSFDEDNRQKIPKDTELPSDIAFFGNAATKEAEAWIDSIEAETYGDANCWLPYTFAGAKDALNAFLKERFAMFGPYEDAMTTEGVRLWHSALSPLINCGLLCPRQVLETALKFAKQNDVPLNSLEGFVRQVIGWREFIRASYVVDGNKMRTSNFFKHTGKLSTSFWTGKTDIEPVDHVIKTALTYGYTHHIERLMVMGNFMLLSKIHPDEVYRWFMGVYLDAYDWVMVPNVYGMSQFADGGSFATKPYISGANYIKKMSDFEKGSGDNNWEEIWTALYWNFITDHIEYFKSNHRLSMMPRTLARIKEETRSTHLERAKQYLADQA